jgi:GNAT superfamily N-acetyltransferase
MKVSLEDDADDTIQKALVVGMRAFNAAATGGILSQKIAIAIRDDGGNLLGGVIGRLAGDSIYMEIVFAEEQIRNTGLGREMMLMAEAEAKRRGAREAWLYTMSFQAKPFYEKLGYRQFAELPWEGAKHARHFMRKEL